MAKTIFEEMGGKYERQGDYLIPCLTVPAEEEQPIGIWGQRHLDYLKHHCKVTYTNLLTSGRLNAYLADMRDEKYEQELKVQKANQRIFELQRTNEQMGRLLSKIPPEVLEELQRTGRNKSRER